MLKPTEIAWIRRLADKRVSLHGISRKTGFSRVTVRRVLQRTAKDSNAGQVDANI